MQKHILDQIDPKVLGARLAQARKARGMTQQAVADEMEVARTTLVAVEKGERRVTPEELIGLAALYGRPVAEFVSKQVVTTGFVPQFRAECYNLLNTPQFAAPNGAATSAQFGTVTRQANTSRQFQFALKISF